jgi:hypothetical protein
MDIEMRPIDWQKSCEQQQQNQLVSLLVWQECHQQLLQQLTAKEPPKKIKM